MFKDYTRNEQTLVGCFMIAVLCLVVSSCSDNMPDVQPHVPSFQGKAISFHGRIDQVQQTRADDNGFVSGDRMGIYIVDRPNGMAGKLHATDNHASNVLFTYDAEDCTWSAPTDLYWTDDVTPIDIYGYYPGVNYIDNPESWFFEVASDQSAPAANGDLSGYEKSDLLWGNNMNVSPTSNTIVLTYTHRLAGARVSLVKGSGFTDTEWNKLERIVCIENTVRQSSVDLSKGTAIVDASVATTPIRMLHQPTGKDYRAVVIPQTVAAGKALLSITLGGQTYTHSLTTDMEWEAGRLHNFTMTVNKREASGDYEIKVTDDGIMPWVNDEASHQFSAMAYVVVNCDKHGSLKESITKAGYDYRTIQNLKVTGEVDADDYSLLAKEMPELRHLNLREAVSRHVMVEHNWETDEDYYEDDVFTGFYGNKTIRSIAIPSSTKVIHNDAFREMQLMYSTVEIPEGVTEIRGTAFAYNEYNGVELILPSTINTVQDCAFYDCGWKCELKLTDNITYIGEAAFSRCPNFYGVFHVPSKLKELKEGMFMELGSNGSFTGEIEIPQGITEIPNGYWGGTFGVALKNKTAVALPTGLKRLMSGFGNLSSIHFNDDLEVIGDGAFYNSRLYFSINLPQSLREIGAGAFCDAHLEGELVIPETCLTIGGNPYQGAFSSNEITRIVLPSKLEAIPQEFCFHNPELREVNIPKFVDYIGDYAFNDCPSIQTIVCLNPEPPRLGQEVFDGMYFDKVVLQVPEASVESYRHADGWSDFKNITPYRELAFNIPEILTLDKGMTLTGILRSEGPWEVTECPDWVTVTPACGTYKEELTVTVKPMANEGDREGRIAISLKGKDYTIYTPVHQYSLADYREDQTIVLQKASSGAPHEIPLFIVGEGYTAEEIVSGQYLEDMKQQMEHLFSCEPYKSYRDYFTVSMAIACSPEHGLDGRTRFDTGIDYLGGVFYTDESRVWEYVDQHGAGIDGASHGRTTVMMLINTHQLFNTVKLDDDGYSLALCGMTTDIEPFDQRGLVLRDVGGRAFGHLATEAVSHFTFFKACTCPGCSSLKDYRRGVQNGWYGNISLTGKMNEVAWNHLIFHPAYAAQVDMFEGGYNHARGVYRSENMSVMGNVPIPYFNTISREIIVRRIKQDSGEEYSFDDFVANDKMEIPSDYQ